MTRTPPLKPADKAVPKDATTPEQTRRRFAEIVEREGGPSAVALRLGCTASTVQRIIAGTRDPGLDLARSILELYGIRPEAWRPKPQIEMVARIATG